MVCETPEGSKTITGDIFISSMPIQDLIAGMDGCDNTEVQRIAAGLPYRDFVTVGLLVNKLNLVNQTGTPTLGNIVPDCWIYVQDKGVKLGRIQIFNNWSPYMVEKPEETVWIGLEYFCAEAVLDAHREKVKKAYPAYFDTYAQFDQVVDYLNTFDNLFCVGRNGQHRYNNMDHSMLTAIHAADAIKHNSTDKGAVWNVNQEKEYHEQK